MSLIINGIEVDLEKVAKEAGKKSREKVEPVGIIKQFQAQVLNIVGLRGEIDVLTHSADCIEVALNGDKTVVESIKMNVQGQTLLISGASSSNNVVINNGSVCISGNGNVVSNSFKGVSIGGGFIGGNVVVMNGGNISINTTDDQACSLKAKIKVPVGTDIDVSTNSGKVTIGNVDSDVDLDFSGRVESQVGSIKSLDVDMSGRCDLTVARVDGDVNIDLDGNCSIVVNSGEISKLKVDVSGKSQVQLNCTARKANLDASGMSRIYLRHAIKNPRQDSSGMSRITVGSIG